MRVTIDIYGTVLESEAPYHPTWDEGEIGVGFGANAVELTFWANGKPQGVRIPKADWLGIAGLVREREG